jgi:MFS transporter, FSR family, fosmidomycin resistance protein
VKRLTKDDITVWCYSLAHGLVDFASTLVVYNAAIVHGLAPTKAVALIIMYDLLAFAVQPLVGFVIDYTKGARIAMLAGIMLTLTGVVCMRANALTGIAVVGIGNALFHLGTGAQILGRYPNTASTTGIFVGPGALGLSIGFWFGSCGFFPLWSLAIGLTAACIGLASLPALKPIPAPTKRTSYQVKSRPIVLLLLLAAIVIRGFVGRTGFADLPSDAFVIIGLGAAACIGKMAGGRMADRFGWGHTAITVLVLASIGIVFVRNNIGVAFATMILFQMTMPITLVATSAALPGKPAFAFGLSCLALVCGTLPAFYTPQGLIQLPITLAMIWGSGGCIIMALWLIGAFTVGRCRKAIETVGGHFKIGHLGALSKCATFKT